MNRRPNALRSLLTRSLPLAVMTLLTAFCLLPSAFSQSATATISGTVVDQQGAVVPGATVTVINAATGQQRQATTGDEGNFTVPSLPPATYTIRVEREGFAIAEVSNVVLNVNDQKSISIPLKAGTISEMVKITGEAPLINESPAVATTIDRTFVGNLPLNGRSFQSLILLTPGVTLASDPAASDPGQFSVNGQRGNANYFTVDGVSANIGASAFAGPATTSQAGAVPGLSAFGGTNNLVSVDALEEFKIQTSTYSAELGRQPGGQISLVTRSGSNQFHGTVFEYFRNEALDARNYFNKVPAPKTPLRQNQFGGTFSGPVFLPHLGEGAPGWYNGKNRTFFFFSYEGQRLRLPINGVANVPSLRLRELAAPAVKQLLNAFPLPTGPEFVNGAGQPTGFATYTFGLSEPRKMDSASLRIDQTLGNTLTVFGRYNDSTSSTISHASTSLSTPADAQGSTQTLTAGATWVPTPRVSNELRINYSRQREKRSNSMDAFAGAVPIDISAVTTGYSGTASRRGNVTISFNGFASFLNLGSSGDSLQRQLNIVDNISVIKGSHHLKVGVDYRRLFPVQSVVEYEQALNFLSEAGIANGTLTSLSVFSRQSFRPIFNNFSAFVQDTWRVSPRLNLALGIRWEVNPAPHEATGKRPVVITGVDNLATATLASSDAPFYDTVYTAFAPRVGGAYQLSQRTGWETVLRGGFGLYYDLGSGQATRGFFYNVPFTAQSFQSGVQYPVSLTLAAPPAFPGLTLPIASPISVSDPSLKLPYTLHWNLALEQSLAAQQSVSLSYVASAGRRLLTTQRLNSKPDFSPVNPNFDQVFVTSNGPTSDYHSLQAQYKARFQRDGQALVNYTWSHAIDEVSDEISNLFERGNASFDVRHNLSAALVYNVPTPTSRGVIHRILRDWSLYSIVTAQSGRPVNIRAGSRRIVTSDGGVLSARPDVIAGVPLYVSDPTVPGGRRFNAAAFRNPPTGRQGSFGRNVLRELALYQVDVALRRNFNFGEKMKMQLKVEAFNVLNHPSFSRYNSNFTPGSATFGVPSSTLNNALIGFSSLYQIGGPRSIQLSLRLSF